MKTTIEISDSLLIKAKQLAREQHTTLRSLTEEGLAKVLAERAARKPTKIQAVTFSGRGFSTDFKGASWQQLRDEAYRGHGA